MGLLINWIVSTAAILVTAYFLPGAHIANLQTAFLAAFVLGVINAIVKPILIILTLPINLITLGLFTLVINAFLILLASSLVPGFRIDGFWWALIFSIVLALVNGLLHKIFQ